MDSLNVKADSPLEEMPRVQHNTNVVHHAGRLFALVENGMPFELDPKTLDPMGLFDMAGRAVGFSTSAHPKVDGRTGEMLFSDNFKDFRRLDQGDADPVQGMFANLYALEDRISGIFAQRRIEARRIIYTD